MLTHSVFLEPERYYSRQEMQAIAYETVYYFGLDPYYLQQGLSKPNVILDLIFLLLMTDVIILSPSATLGPFYQQRHFLQFVMPFWQDNSITTSLWHGYKHQLEAFILEQVDRKQINSQQLKSLHQFLAPTGQDKAFFLRDPQLQVTGFQRLFYQLYRQLFVIGKRQDVVYAYYSDPNAAKKFQSHLFQRLERQQAYDGKGFNRVQIMQALADHRLVGPFPDFIIQGTRQAALMCYCLMGSQSQSSYLFPSLPPRVGLHLEPTLLASTGPHLNLFAFGQFLKNYGIQEHDLLQQLKPHQLQQLRREQRELLVRFRRAFKHNLEQSGGAYTVKPFVNSKGQSLYDRLCFALEDFCQNQSRQALNRITSRTYAFQASVPVLQIYDLTLSYQNTKITLSRSEMLVFRYLYGHRQKAYSIAHLAQELHLSDSTVRQCFTRLRKKLLHLDVIIEIQKQTHHGKPVYQLIASVKNI